MYVNGRLSALQADDAGSIPVVRSIDKNARASDRFLAYESSFSKNSLFLRSKHGLCLQAACLERIDYSPPNAELVQRQNLSFPSWGCGFDSRIPLQKIFWHMEVPLLENKIRISFGQMHLSLLPAFPPTCKNAGKVSTIVSAVAVTAP